MTLPEIPPAPEGDRELLDLACTLLGVTHVDLLKVRQEGDGLVVILVSGKKYRFDAGDIAKAVTGQIEVWRTQLEGAPGLPPAEPPAAAATESEPIRNGASRAKKK